MFRFKPGIAALVSVALIFSSLSLPEIAQAYSFPQQTSIAKQSTETQAFQRIQFDEQALTLAVIWFRNALHTSATSRMYRNTPYAKLTGRQQLAEGWYRAAAELPLKITNPIGFFRQHVLRGEAPAWRYATAIALSWLTATSAGVVVSTIMTNHSAWAAATGLFTSLLVFTVTHGLIDNIETLMRRAIEKIAPLNPGLGRFLIALKPARLSLERTDSKIRLNQELQEKLKPSQLHSALEQARSKPTGAPVTILNASPKSLETYALQLQRGFGGVGEALVHGQTIVAGPHFAEGVKASGADITLVQVHGSENEEVILDGSYPGKKIVLVHRPEEYLLRHRETGIENLRQKADAIVLLGPAMLEDYRRERGTPKFPTFGVRALPIPGAIERAPLFHRP